MQPLLPCELADVCWGCSWLTSIQVTTATTRASGVPAALPALHGTEVAAWQLWTSLCNNKGSAAEREFVYRRKKYKVDIVVCVNPPKLRIQKSGAGGVCNSCCFGCWGRNLFRSLLLCCYIRIFCSPGVLELSRVCLH